MVTNRLHIDLALFSVFFSFFFCFLCSVVDSLLGFWVFLELCGMSIIPGFFYYNAGVLKNFYNSLLNYIVVSGLSSVLFMVGLVIKGFYLFIFLGFILKLGMFPFSIWAYRVFSGSNWIFIFLLSVVMKFPILFFCFLFHWNILTLVNLDCFLTILMCSLYLWLLNSSWEYVWCSISLSSVSTLMVACFCSDEVTCFFIYFYYFFWSIGVLLLFNRLSCDGWSNGVNFYLFVFLLLVTPVSLPLFYKLGVVVGIIYSSFYLLFMWSVYSFSEQFFLYSVASDYIYGNVYNNWLV